MGARVGIAGACGRMGRAIAREVGAAGEALELAAVWEHAEHASVGAPYEGAPDLRVAGGLGQLGALDVVIDFTSPAATVAHAAWCAERGTAIVIGTTGLTAEHQAALDAAAARVPLLQAPNMSVGVNALLALVESAARMLGEGWDLEIVETHHRRKKDAPSGTALALLSALRRARDGAEARFERYGDIGARTDAEIGVQTLRGGDVVGEHTVFYFGEGERLELTHRATDRRIFAAGAVRAARWLLGRPPGRYAMPDVLGVSS